MKRLHLKLSLAILAMVLPVYATTVRKVQLDELVKRSDSIVQGKVETIEVRYDSERKAPYTWVRLRVDDPLKGERRQTVFIKHLGGRYYDEQARAYRTLTVSGAPHYQVAENVIVFLKLRTDGSYETLGSSQGKYQVVDEVAVSNVSGVDVVDPGTGKLMPTGFVEKLPVESLKARIRELMK